MSTPPSAHGDERPSVLLFRRRSLVIAGVIAVLLALVLPALVAHRYTAPEQRGEFVRRPWRGWAFAYAALAVPGSSELKTSGMALRKAEWIFKGTAMDPREVQLLYTMDDAPHAYSNIIGERRVTGSVTPSYHFIWQVRGSIETLPGTTRVIIALLDYETGRVLYDIRDDLLPEDLSPSSPATPDPNSTP